MHLNGDFTDPNLSSNAKFTLMNRTQQFTKNHGLQCQSKFFQIYIFQAAAYFIVNFSFSPVELLIFMIFYELGQQIITKCCLLEMIKY